MKDNEKFNLHHGHQITVQFLLRMAVGETLTSLYQALNVSVCLKRLYLMLVVVTLAVVGFYGDIFGF